MFKSLLALILLSSPLLAATSEYFGVEQNKVMKIVACTNGLRNYLEISEQDLGKGFQFKHEGQQLEAKLLEKKYEQDGKFYPQVEITDVETGKVKGRLVLDNNKALGKILLEDYPMFLAGKGTRIGKNVRVIDLDNVGKGGEGGEKDPRIKKITGLANVEHLDPKSGKVFYVWHMLNNVETLIKTAE